MTRNVTNSRDDTLTFNQLIDKLNAGRWFGQRRMRTAMINQLIKLVDANEEIKNTGGYRTGLFHMTGTIHAFQYMVTDHTNGDMNIMVMIDKFIFYLIIKVKMNFFGNRLIHKSLMEAVWQQDFDNAVLVGTIVQPPPTLWMWDRTNRIGNLTLYELRQLFAVELAEGLFDVNLWLKQALAEIAQEAFVELKHHDEADGIDAVVPLWPGLLLEIAEDEKFESRREVHPRDWEISSCFRFGIVAGSPREKCQLEVNWGDDGYTPLAQYDIPVKKELVHSTTLDGVAPYYSIVPTNETPVIRIVSPSNRVMNAMPGLDMLPASRFPPKQLITTLITTDRIDFQRIVSKFFEYNGKNV